ncbi:hypothetical protein [Kitasatospora sp. NPDC087314]|uniref:hypothetical protein n=1 Tax=Kitasatospora sp. NPDC087314 TaxID=3364068 RepID=UPI0037FF0BFA
MFPVLDSLDVQELRWCRTGLVRSDLNAVELDRGAHATAMVPHQGNAERLAMLPGGNGAALWLR